jgi:IS5 family transposase
VYAAYRFAVKLRTHRQLLDACIGRVLGRLQARNPSLGENIAIDASDLPAWASVHTYTPGKGHTPVTDYADGDAAWGYRTAVATRKTRWYYGYKLHAVVCSMTGLPLAWSVRPACEKEGASAIPLLETTIRRGLPVQTVAMDKGYDAMVIYDECLLRGTLPVIPEKKVRTGTAKGPRRSRFLPRHTARWKALYKARSAIEREFGNLKNEWAMLPLRVRGLDRVQLHVDLTILAKLCCATA